MRSRRRVVALFGIAALATCAAAACSFPDVEFAPSGASEAGPAESDAGLDGTPVPQKPQPDVDPDGSMVDATKAGDATAQVDAAGCKTCDCDKDGYDRVDLDAGCDGGNGTKGKKADCDDLIAAIHPDIDGFLSDLWPAEAKHTPAGDWDCSGATTYQFAYGATCAALTSCAGGFVGTPPCGATSDFIACQQAIIPLLGLTCSEDKSKHQNPGVLTQGCR